MSKTVIITDGKDRSALAAARSLGKNGWTVIVTQTRAESSAEPPVFYSKYVKGIWIDGSVEDPVYKDRLLKVVDSYDRPVLLCIGRKSLETLSRYRRDFKDRADFIVSKPDVLEQLNDKQIVTQRAQELGIPVPRTYQGTPDAFPVIIKPRCGEKLGLKDRDRYLIVEREDQLQTMLSRMRQRDNHPIVQDLVQGDGFGVSMLLNRNQELISAICHRRIREYPFSGGPSTCCISEYDSKKIDQAYRLLKSFHFSGLAMVEFKGDCLLEVNPRVWGSYPLTLAARSPITRRYAQISQGENLHYVSKDYDEGIKIRFARKDAAAVGDLIRHRKLKNAFRGILDVFRVKEAMKDPVDIKAYRKYLKSNWFQKQ